MVVFFIGKFIGKRLSRELGDRRPDDYAKPASYSSRARRIKVSWVFSL